jgi:hypothetical protein
VATLAHATHDGLRAVTVARAADARLYAGKEVEGAVDDDALLAKLNRMTDAQLDARLRELDAMAGVAQVVVLPALDPSTG